MTTSAPSDFAISAFSGDPTVVMTLLAHMTRYIIPR